MLFRLILMGLALQVFSLNSLGGPGSLELRNLEHDTVGLYVVGRTQLILRGMDPRGVYDVTLQTEHDRPIEARLNADAAGDLYLSALTPQLDKSLSVRSYLQGDVVLKVLDGRRQVFSKVFTVTEDHQHPGTGRQYVDVRRETYQFDGGSGLLYVPISRGEPLPKLPLAVIAHGNGFGPGDYSDLANHLASNGFMVASVQFEDDAEVVDRVAVIVNHVLFLSLKYQPFLTMEMALIGHSRGGEAVIHAASQLSVGGNMMMKVRAVVAMAPTVQEPYQPSRADQSPLLVLYGGRDDDVTGFYGDQDAPVTPFRYVDGAVGPAFRGMIFLDGGGHAGFSSMNPDPSAYDDGLLPGLDPNRQRYLTRAYVTAFLRRYCRHEPEYEPYFTRYWEQYEGPTAQTGVDGIRRRFQMGGRLVIEDFEDALHRQNSLKGGLSAVADYFEQGAVYHLDRFAPHNTRAAAIGWGNGKNTASLRLDIPTGSVVGHFRALTFRVAQVYGDSWNRNDDVTDFHIVMESWNGAARVRLSDFVRINHPLSVVGDSGEDYTKTVLTDVRIPLSAFENLDLRQLRSITFVFDAKGKTRRNTGLLALDDIALEE